MSISVMLSNSVQAWSHRFDIQPDTVVSLRWIVVAWARCLKMRSAQYNPDLYSAARTPLMLQLLVVYFGLFTFRGIHSSVTGFGSHHCFFDQLCAIPRSTAAESSHAGWPIWSRQSIRISESRYSWKLFFRGIKGSSSYVWSITWSRSSLAFHCGTEMFTSQTIASPKKTMGPIRCRYFYYVFNFIVAMIRKRLKETQLLSLRSPNCGNFQY